MKSIVPDSRMNEEELKRNSRNGKQREWNQMEGNYTQATIAGTVLIYIRTLFLA